jgi:hypothetical protein
MINDVSTPLQFRVSFKLIQLPYLQDSFFFSEDVTNPMSVDATPDPDILATTFRDLNLTSPKRAVLQSSDAHSNGQDSSDAILIEMKKMRCEIGMISQRVELHYEVRRHNLYVSQTRPHRFIISRTSTDKSQAWRRSFSRLSMRAIQLCVTNSLSF